jgi:hypothetical protein
MKKILVVKQLNILNIFIVIIYKIFKFEVYVYKFSTRIESWHLLKFLSLQECNFEECINIDFNCYGGRPDDAIDQITSECMNSKMLSDFSPIFIDVNDALKKNRILVKKYVLERCNSLNSICMWVDGYFSDYEGGGKPNVYILGDVCKIGERFLKIRSNSTRVSPIFSSDFFIVSNIALKFFSILYGKILLTIYKAKSTKSSKNKTNQLSFISDDVNTLAYNVLFFPHKSIFYGDLYLKSYFYSVDTASVFHPSNILHVELESVTITDGQHKYYENNNITTVTLPAEGVKKMYSYLVRIIAQIGAKRVFCFLRKDFPLFIALLRNGVRFLSAREIIKENYNAKLALVGYDILFPITLSLALESLKIRTVSVQERFLPTFFSNYPFLIDTYLCDSRLVCKAIDKSNDKFVNSCLPCGQIRSDILINYQKNITSKNKRFTIVAFDYHSESNFDDNRLSVLINWKANANFYKDLCNLAEAFPQVDIIIRGKNTDWTKISYFKNVLNKVNRIPNIWIDEDYSKLNKQYELASRSDLVIAKHSSIGDEIIATGKRVIYYDYIPNSKNHFASEHFNYNKCNIFAYSFTQLEDMVKIVVNGGELLTDDEVLELQVITNNMPADGNVKNRVMENLNIIYNQTCL